MVPNGTGATGLNGPTWPMTSAYWGRNVVVVYQTSYVTDATGYHRAPEPVGFFRDAAGERRARSRAKAVPPTSLPGNPEDRIAPLPLASSSPALRAPPPHRFAARLGAPRERTCRRSRHRPRTWERDGATTP